MVAEARDQDLGRALLVERSLVRSLVRSGACGFNMPQREGLKERGKKCACIHGDCDRSVLAMGVPYGRAACRASAPVLFRWMLG